MARGKADTEDATTADIVPSDNPMTYINKEAKGLDYIPDSFEEAMRMAEDMGGGQVIEFRGSPYTIVQKENLLGIPFVITDVRMYSGDFGDAVAVMIVSKEEVNGENKLVFNDGSTGVYQQVVEMVKHSGIKGGIYCPNGLRKSEYTVDVVDPFEPEKGAKQVPSVTYYIN